MAITIHKLPVGSFTSLQCLSGTELLNQSGTPYINMPLSVETLEPQTLLWAIRSHSPTTRIVATRPADGLPRDATGCAAQRWSDNRSAQRKQPREVQ
jgi:hypothetical protein